MRKASSPLRHSKPICDHFYWRRIIMDEAHEIIPIYFYKRISLLQLNCTFFFVNPYAPLLTLLSFLSPPRFLIIFYSTSERATIKIQMDGQRNSVPNEVKSLLLTPHSSLLASRFSLRPTPYSLLPAHSSIPYLLYTFIYLFGKLLIADIRCTKCHKP